MRSAREVRFTVRLSERERAELASVARQRRVPVSALVRAGIERVLADPDSAPRRTRPARRGDEAER